jgi:hypothetical protein
MAVLLSRVDFQHPARSRPERTRWEDRHLRSSTSYGTTSGAIGAVVSIVQVVPKDGESQVRVRMNVPPIMGLDLIRGAVQHLEGPPDSD